MRERLIETDILILGGGLAGCVAAIRGREQGARVAIVDKAAMRRSGSSGTGNHFLTTYLNHGEPWDTAEVYRQWYHDIRHGMVDMKVVDELVVRNQPAVVAYMEKLGVPLKDPKTGQYVRMARPWTGQVHAVVYKAEGEFVKPMLVQKVRESGAEVFEKVHVNSLLMSKGRVIGATGFHIRSGDFYIFKAKAVVLAMGNPRRVLDTPNHNAFNTGIEANPGTGYALAFKAGAELANLEFLATFVYPKYCTAAQVLYEAGGIIRNALGERVVERPDQPGERSFGYGLIAAAAREVNAGRGPLYMDCRHLSKEAMESLRKNLLLDALLLEEYLGQSGIDLGKDLLEFYILTTATSATGSPKGIIIDEKCGTGVEGLYAIGDMSTPSDAHSGAWTTGYVVGVEAAKYAAGSGQVEPVRGQIEEEKLRTYAPLERGEGMSWQEFEETVRWTMIEHVGQVRTDLGLKTALSQFKKAEEYRKELKADNYHELMRVHEAMDALLFDQLMTSAALERTESRYIFLGSHYRADYPRQDDAHWRGVSTIVKRVGDSISSSHRRMN